MTVRQCRSPVWARSEEGVSLVEIVVAIFILGVAIIALAGVATQSLMAVRNSRQRQQATDAASAVIESARAAGYDALALRSNVGVPSTGPTPYAAEPTIVTSGGPIVFEQTAGAGNTLTVKTWVTWTNQTITGGTVVPDAYKRVFVQASWNTGNGRTDVVTEETLVAPADRGLPVPKFDISPAQQTVQFTPAETDRECAVHTITNLGAEDSYEFELANPPESNSLPGAAPDGTFTDSARKWRAVAYFELVGSSSAPSLDETTRMIDTNGDGWVELNGAAGRLPPRESAFLSVCYVGPSDTGAVTSHDAWYRVRVRSRFDNQVNKVVRDDLATGSVSLHLYLHENTSNHNGNWANGHARKIGNHSYPIMPMDTQAPTSSVGHDHDDGHGEDPFGLPGLWLPDSDSLSYPAGAVWDYPFTQSTTVSNGTLTIWVSSASANVDLRLDARLEKRQQDGTLVSSVATGHVDYRASAAGSFVPVTIDLPFTSSTTFSSTDLLRLHVWCDQEHSHADCAVDYDLASQDANLAVTG